MVVRTVGLVNGQILASTCRPRTGSVGGRGHGPCSRSSLERSRGLPEARRWAEGEAQRRSFCCTYPAPPHHAGPTCGSCDPLDPVAVLRRGWLPFMALTRCGGAASAPPDPGLLLTVWTKGLEVSQAVSACLRLAARCGLGQVEWGMGDGCGGEDRGRARFLC